MSSSLIPLFAAPPARVGCRLGEISCSLLARVGESDRHSVEVTFSFDPAISVAAFNDHKYGARAVDATGGVLRFFLRDFIDDDFTAVVSVKCECCSTSA